MQQATQQPSSVRYLGRVCDESPLLGLVLSPAAKLDDAVDVVRAFVVASRILSAGILDPTDTSRKAARDAADAAALMASLAEAIIDQMGQRRFDAPHSATQTGIEP